MLLRAGDDERSKDREEGSANAPFFMPGGDGISRPRRPIRRAPDRCLPRAAETRDQVVASGVISPLSENIPLMTCRPARAGPGESSGSRP
jgi:hypothetical protein